MKNGLYSILVLALFTLSCSEQQYFVKGKSTQSTIDGEYAYMGPMNSPQVLYFDSCRVVHGKFEMTGPLDSVLCVTIYMGSMRIPMVLEDGEVIINYQNSNIQVSGTPLNEMLYSFLTTRDSLVFVQKELYHRVTTMDVRSNESAEYNEKSAELKHVTQQIDSLECDFIRSNYDNVLGASWFLHVCNEASENSGFYMVPPQLQLIYQSAPSSFKSNWDIQNFIRKCNGSTYSKDFEDY